MKRKRIPTARLVEDLLRALSLGQLSTESVVRGLLKAGTRSPEWLQRRLDAVKEVEPRKPRVRRTKPITPERAVELLERARQKFRSMPNVVGVSWGMKYRGARTVGERALVVWVARKESRDDLASKDRIPGVFKARIGRRTHSYQIDVQPVARGAKHGPAQQVRPGNRVTVQVANERGSLSAFIEPVAGGRVLISGHVGIQKGNPVTASLPDGSSINLGVVGKIRNDALVDAALILDAPTSQIDALTLSPAAIRDLSAGEIGLLIRVMTPDGAVEAAVDATDAPADFGSDGSMDGLIRLDRRVTDPGDSGSPVVDRDGNVLGFVVGAATVVDDGDGTERSHTFVLTSRRALDVVNSP